MEDTQFQRLISLWLDGALSEDEVRGLERRLLENSEDRQMFLVWARYHAEFYNQARSQELLDDIQSAGESLPFSPAAARPRNPLRSAPWAAVALAASVLLAMGTWRATEAWRRGPGPVEPPAVVASSPILDSIDPLSKDCRWYVEEAQRGGPRDIQSGDVIRVTNGALSLTYAEGTSVVLHSPAAFQPLSGNRARMFVGRLTATVPEAGKGFTVITPQANVIDLGTEFGVEVGNDGATDVVVFKGQVDVNYHDRSTEAKRLRMGEAVRVDAGGTVSRLVSVSGEAYSSRPQVDASRTPLIAEVRDNIERDPSMLSFYEIVPGGMREDALSHVDRIAHEYNGITPEGMPEYLVGADYVKTFNSKDKFASKIRIAVSLSRPARLYILFDSRHAPPNWLVDEFTDTGDVIGLDNGPYRSRGPHWHNKGPSGVGPGESIDDALTVWVREVESAGVVRLGPMGAPLGVGANMYGIAATPLD